MESKELGELTLLSLSDALRKLAPKREVVTVHLKSGQSLTGALASIGAELVQLAELGPNRQFYDGLVLLSEIAGFEVRARTR